MSRSQWSDTTKAPPLSAVHGVLFLFLQFKKCVTVMLSWACTVSFIYNKPFWIGRIRVPCFCTQILLVSAGLRTSNSLTLVSLQSFLGYFGPSVGGLQFLHQGQSRWQTTPNLIIINYYCYNFDRGARLNQVERTWMKNNIENWKKISKWWSGTLCGKFQEENSRPYSLDRFTHDQFCQTSTVQPDFPRCGEGISPISNQKEYPAQNTGKDSVDPLMAVKTLFFTIPGWNQLGSTNSRIMFISRVFTCTTFKSELSRAHV